MTLSQGAVPQWRDISTAPKDGETVLIFTPRTFPQVTAAHYRDDIELEHWQAVGHRWHHPADVKAWMPLPAPPEQP